MSAVRPSALRAVAAIAGNTFREALRMRLFVLLAVAAMASLGLGFAFRDFNFGASELKFIADFGFGGMTLMGSILAIVVTTQLLYGEIEHRTVLTLLARPVGRGAFLAGKLLGAWLAILCFVAALSASLALALWIRGSQLAAVFPEQFENGGGVSIAQVFVLGALQAFRFAALSGAAALFCSYATSSLFAIFMSLFLWLIGQLQPLAAEAAGRSGNILLDAAFYVASLAAPNFQAFEVGDQIVAGGGVGLGAFAQLAVYGALYALLYASLASLFLSKREF